MADSLLGGIVINEILVDPNGANNFDTDGNGTAAATDEYVELYNSSGAPIDISGLELWDDGVGQWFTFPPGTILAPGAHAMVMSGVQSGGSLPTGAPGDLFFDAGRGSPLINNGGDNVVLYDPGGDEFVQATFNGDALDNPVVDYPGFSPTATRSGTGEDFGVDNDGFSIQRGPDGSDTFVNDETPTPGTTNICFTSGTQIATPDGPRRIESLNAGDILCTRDDGPQPIRWIGRRQRSVAEMRDDPRLCPVAIRAGALGPGCPARDMRVSQHHRILIGSKVVRRMFGAERILVPAKDLVGAEGVSLVQPRRAITYFHILMQRHSVLWADGVAAESLYLGPMAVGSLEAAALEEVGRILAMTPAELLRLRPAPAHPMVSGRRVHRLITRHRRNAKPLIEAA